MVAWNTLKRRINYGDGKQKRKEFRCGASFAVSFALLLFYLWVWSQERRSHVGSNPGRSCWREISSEKPAGIASSKQELSLGVDLDINQGRASFAFLQRGWSARGPLSRAWEEETKWKSQRDEAKERERERGALGGSFSKELGTLHTRWRLQVFFPSPCLRMVWAWKKSRGNVKERKGEREACECWTKSLEKKDDKEK